MREFVEKANSYFGLDRENTSKSTQDALGQKFNNYCSPKVRKMLGWTPKIRFNELTKITVDADTCELFKFAGDETKF